MCHALSCGTGRGFQERCVLHRGLACLRRMLTRGLRQAAVTRSVPRRSRACWTGSSSTRSTASTCFRAPMTCLLSRGWAPMIAPIWTVWPGVRKGNGGSSNIGRMKPPALRPASPAALARGASLPLTAHRPRCQIGGPGGINNDRKRSARNWAYDLSSAGGDLSTGRTDCARKDWMETLLPRDAGRCQRIGSPPRPCRKDRLRALRRVDLSR